MLKKNRATPKHQLELLQNDQELKEEYAATVKNRYQRLLQEDESKGNSFETAISTTTKEFIPKEEKRRKTNG